MPMTSTRSPTPPLPSTCQNLWRVDQLLALASTHEVAELSRYRRLAFSFLTFNTGISRLLAGLGIECEKRLKRLTHTAQRMELPYPLSSSDHYYAKLREKDADPQYFIGSEGMAIEALTQALVDAEMSRCFYEHLREASDASPLHSLLDSIFRQKQAELDVLSERLTNGDGLTRPAALC